MTDETLVATGDAGATPAAPKSDYEAEAVEAKVEERAEPPKPAEDEAEKEKKRNRTREYIAKINQRNAEQERRIRELEAQIQPKSQAKSAPSDDAPTLEGCDYDFERFQRETALWAVKSQQKQAEETNTRRAAEDRETQVFADYSARAHAFAEANPDFYEVADSIRYQIPMETQAAIAGHELGPQMAYHLGNNPKDAFEFARTPPHLADALIEELSSRLQEAHKAPVARPSLAPAPKPMTKAPPPPQTVGGRGVTEVPDEKLTDDEWMRREQQRARERRRR